MDLDKIRTVDSDIATYIEEELERQRTTIELIASENFTSQAVMQACGTVLTNKYAEGKPHKRYYNGCEVVDKIEEKAQNMRVKFLVWIMLMFNRILVRKRIWLCLCLFFNVVIKF